MSGCVYGRVCMWVAEAEGWAGGGEVKRCLEEEPTRPEAMAAMNEELTQQSSPC